MFLFFQEKGKTTFRSITVDGSEIEFSDGFTELHTISYKKILEGKGYKISDSRDAIQITYDIRNMTPIGLKGDYHPMAKLKPASTHLIVNVYKISKHHQNSRLFFGFR